MLGAHVRVAKLAEASLVDGPGLRTVVWFQGCGIRCEGCQNKTLWTNDGGEQLSTEYVASMLVAMNALGQCEGNGKFTITGGEPFRQVSALNKLLVTLRKRMPDAHIVLYTGSTWEALRGRGAVVCSALATADIVVDGPYIEALDHDGLAYRGSSNQRPILARQSLASGVVITTNWDGPMATIHDGKITMPAALATDLGMEGTDSNLCGQYEEAK